MIASGDIKLSELPLGRGKHTLTVEIVGKNDKAIAGYMFGLDYFRFEKK
ncbi:MAG: hypothetical protein HY286_05310 [Planctomycetes bacterium]|nr:hypothetical protein [Planctomycetota bacterium]